MTNPTILVDGVSRAMTDAELASFNATQTAGAAEMASLQASITAQTAMPDRFMILGILVDVITQLVTANAVDLSKLTVAQRAAIQKIKNNRAALGV